MRYRKLDAYGDYSFGNGPLDFYRDEPAAVGQSVMTRLLLWLNEWYLNSDDGTPFMQGILGKYPQSTADSTIQDRILETTGVVDISSYESELDPDTRGLSSTVSIDTIYGPTQVQVTNYGNY